MGRVSTVIDNARAILADPNKTRWSDTRLLSLYNQCLIDIVIQTNLLNGKAFVEIESNINTYRLPDEVLQINRVQYLDKKISIISHDQMDQKDALWETRVGTELEYAVTNLLNAGTFKIYPRITDTTMDYIDSNSPYGIIIDVTTFDDIYNIPGIENLNDIPKYMIIYYSKIPNIVALDTIDTDLQFSKAWDNALIHYIVGMSLRDDGDAQNRAFGNEEITIYGSTITNIMNRVSTNFTMDIESTVSYRGFIQ